MTKRCVFVYKYLRIFNNRKCYYSYKLQLILNNFCEETFCSRTRFVAGNIFWQQTFCSRKNLLDESFYSRKLLFAGNVLQQETFCGRKRFVAGNGFQQETFVDRKRFVAGNVLCRKRSVSKHSVRKLKRFAGAPLSCMSTRLKHEPTKTLQSIFIPPYMVLAEVPGVDRDLKFYCIHIYIYILSLIHI